MTSEDSASSPGDSHPRSPLRTVQVLHALAAHAREVSLASLAAELQLPKTSLFRLLRSLEEGGYVSSRNGLHQVGPQALKLGAALVQSRAFPLCARPVMEWLAGRSEETVILAAPDETGTQIVYSEVIEPVNPLRFSIRPGLTRPLFSSASGQVLLAFRPSEARDEYLRQTRFVKLASQTVTDPEALGNKLVGIRKQGFAVSVDGMFDGVYSIAAPLLDAHGAVHAAVSISAPSSRGAQQEARFLPLLMQAGEEISRLTGHTGAYPPA